jgi:hypothetical protein
MIFRLKVVLLFFLLASFSLVLLGQADRSQDWGHWRIWGAQKDGTYRNPVLPADYSDVDCIRVAEEYYAPTIRQAPGRLCTGCWRLKVGMIAARFGMMMAMAI